MVSGVISYDLIADNSGAWIGTEVCFPDGAVRYFAGFIGRLWASSGALQHILCLYNSAEGKVMFLDTSTGKASKVYNVGTLAFTKQDFYLLYFLVSNYSAGELVSIYAEDFCCDVLRYSPEQGFFAFILHYNDTKFLYYHSPSGVKRIFHILDIKQALDFGLVIFHDYGFALCCERVYIDTESPFLPSASGERYIVLYRSRDSFISITRRKDLNYVFSCTPLSDSKVCITYMDFDDVSRQVTINLS